MVFFPSWSELMFDNLTVSYMVCATLISLQGKTVMLIGRLQTTNLTGTEHLAFKLPLLSVQQSVIAAR